MSEHGEELAVSVVVPCLNEVGTVGEVLDEVAAHLADFSHEVIVIDDGSDDGTGELLDASLGTKFHRLVRHESRRGKGACVRAGIGIARGEIVVVQDADLEYHPSDLPALLAPILAGEADVVYGSRFLNAPRPRGMWRLHQLGNQFLTWLSNRCTGLRLSDMETGYKAVRRELLAEVTLERDAFGIEPEITAKLAKLGARFREVPISYHGRNYREGKKIKWRDGVAAVRNILNYR